MKRFCNLKRSNLLFLIVVVVGLGLVSIATNQASTTGMVVSSSACVDSDGGLNYYVYGYVTYKNRNYYDYCSGNYLIESYCFSDKPASQKYRCPNGCYNGRCVQPTGCIDECKYSGQIICLFISPPAYWTCGNYDADECLEWSKITYCSSVGLCPCAVIR